MVLRARSVLARWIEPVDFSLQPIVHARMREEAVNQSSHRAGRRVRARDDSERTVVHKLRHRRWLPGVRWQVFLVLHK